MVGAWSGLGRARARAYGSGKQHMSSIKTQVYSDSDKKYFYMHNLTDKSVCAHCMHACRIHNKMESTFGHRNITYEKERAVHELDSFSTLPNLRQKSVRAWCMNPSESDQCDRCTENDQIV